MSSFTIEQMALELEKWRKENDKSRLPEDLKKKVLSFQQHYRLSEISKRLNIPRTNLSTWAYHSKLKQPKKDLKLETPTQSFIELPPITLPAHRIILKLKSGMKFIFEGEIKEEYLAELAFALHRRELP